MIRFGEITFQGSSKICNIYSVYLANYLAVGRTQVAFSFQLSYAAITLHYTILASYIDIFYIIAILFISILLCCL